MWSIFNVHNPTNIKQGIALCVISRWGHALAALRLHTNEGSNDFSDNLMAVLVLVLVIHI